VAQPAAAAGIAVARRDHVLPAMMVVAAAVVAVAVGAEALARPTSTASMTTFRSSPQG
jgi:hypothetical protein